MDELIPCLIVAVLALPVVAIIIAVARTTRLRDEVEQMRGQLSWMQKELQRMGVERLRRAGSAPGAMPPEAAPTAIPSPTTSATPSPPAAPPAPTAPPGAPVSPREVKSEAAPPVQPSAPARESVPAMPGPVPVSGHDPARKVSRWLASKSAAPVTPAGAGARGQPVAASAGDGPGGLTPAGEVLKRGLEAKLGAWLFVWIGAIAMALAGVFLVKYTFDQGILTEPVRVVLGVIFGLALLVAGEWLRKRAAEIAQGVSAAGIAVLFASLLAAVNLYHLIGPLTGFALMAVVTALAIVLSLRHGPFVALLGLVGGFLTPVLIRVDEPRPSLFAYLFLLEIGLLAVTRKRGWVLLAGLTLLGGLGWAAAWMLLFYQEAHTSWIGPFLLATAAAFTLASQLGRRDEAWGVEGVSSRGPGVSATAAAVLTWAATLGGLLLTCLLVGVGEFSTLEWSFLGLLGVGCLVLGRLDARNEGLAWLASAAGAALLIVWYVQADELPQTRFGLTALAFGAIHALGGYVCLWRASKPATWASLSVVSGLTYLLVAYFCLDAPPPHLPWGAVCVILAVAYAVGAIPVYRRRLPIEQAEAMFWHERAAGYDGALAALAVGVTALVSLTMPIELERAWIGVAWALEVPALALIDWRLRLPVLRHLARVLAVGVGVRFLLNPAVLSYPIGAAPVLNWLLYGYGLSALALAAGAWLFRFSKDEGLVEWLGGLAIALGFALLTLEVHHDFHRDTLRTADFTLNQSATFTIVWFAYALALLAAAWRWPRRCIYWGGAIAATVALVAAAGAATIAQNPLWANYSVGSQPVVNMLLYIYGLPAVLAALAGWLLGRIGKDPGLTRLFEAASLVLLLVLVTLEVRQYFQGEFLNARSVTHTEWYTYASAWMVYALVLLLIARRWPNPCIVWGGHLIAGLGLLGAVVIQGLVQNPRWTNASVGVRPVLNLLLYVYGLPAILTALIGRELARLGNRPLARVAGSVALALLFALVSLEVRQYFQGEFLDADTMDKPELYAYSAAWVIFGTLLLVLGIVTRGVVLRYASLVVMLIAVGKVFLIDTAHLQDLYRVLSFFGLGLSLLILAYLYQRFVFRVELRTPPV
jgi:uncharacterized membrane protein